LGYEQKLLVGADVATLPATPVKLKIALTDVGGEIPKKTKRSPWNRLVCQSRANPRR
jgi:hypothetical protein